MTGTEGRYRVLRKLGAGGMGEVFLAEDRSLRRHVALKKLAPSRLNEDSRRILLHEARAIARVNHPSIAAIHDVVEEPDGSYLVMEYVPGTTLAERIKEGPLSPAEVIRISRQIADALAAAHSQGVIHRDLKPANIHLMPSGDVKILDFGLARTLHAEIVDASASTTSMSDPIGAGHVVGTLPYIPPEVLMGARADERGDIYSLGVTLFELLTGRLPFPTGNRMAYVSAVTSQDPPRASDVDPAIPQGLAGLVARTMSRDPAARPQSAAALQAELTALGTRGPALRRVATAAVALLLGVSAVALVVQRSRELTPGTPPSQVVAVLPFQSIGADSASGYVAAGMTDIIGTRLAGLPISVAPPGRAVRFRAPDRDPEALAAELGATLVVDGSVQQYGDRLRVTVKLLRRGSNRLDWSDTFDGEMSDVLHLQEDILDGLVEGLASVGGLAQAPTAPERTRLVRAPTTNEEAYADYTQARSFLERDDLRENIPRAITLFQSALRRDPGFAAAMGGLGEAFWATYRRTREPAWADTARATAGRAVDMDSTDARVRMSLAVVLLGTGRLDEAEAELSRVLDEQPKNDRVYSLLGDLHTRAGRSAKAVDSYRRAISLRPSYWEYHRQLGHSLFRNGEFESAEAAARRVTELQPDNPMGHQLLGTIQQAQGSVDEAVESYGKSLALAPTASAHSNIGGTFFDAGDFPRAAGYYRQAIAIDPRLPVYRRNLGDALLESGNRAGADSAYGTALVLADSLLVVNPRDENTTALKALCLAKLKLAEPALAAIQSALALNRTSANVLYKEATVLALLGNGTGALEALERALAAGAPASVASADPDLRSLSSQEEFKQLIARHTP